MRAITFFQGILVMIMSFFLSMRQKTNLSLTNLSRSGSVWTNDTSDLLRFGMEAVSNSWIYKANAYLAELCLRLGCNTYHLSEILEDDMPSMGYSNKEVESITRWIRGFRTGIINQIKINEYETTDFAE